MSSTSNTVLDHDAEPAMFQVFYTNVMHALRTVYILYAGLTISRQRRNCWLRCEISVYSRYVHMSHHRGRHAETFGWAQSAVRSGMLLTNSYKCRNSSLNLNFERFLQSQLNIFHEYDDVFISFKSILLWPKCENYDTILW